MDIARTLTEKYPGAIWSMTGTEYADLEWKDQVIPKPTEAELMAKWEEVVVEDEATRYLKLREAGLPHPLKMLRIIIKQLNYMEMQGQTTLIKEMQDLKQTYLELATKYPKPGP